MKKIIIIAGFFVLINNLHALHGDDNSVISRESGDVNRTASQSEDGNIRFFWTPGDFGISFEGNDDYMEMFPSMNAGNINWITKRGFGWGFHVFSIEGDSDWVRALILPVELSYSPFGDNDKRLFLTLYGRGGWALLYGQESGSSFDGRNGFFGALGLRAAWIPPLNDPWSVFTGAFIEYTSKNEIRMGISIDASVVVTLAALAFGIALSSDDDEDS